MPTTREDMRRPPLLRPTGLVAAVPAVMALLLCCIACVSTPVVAAAASSPTVFASLLISSPLTLQGVDVGSTLTSLESRLSELTTTVAAQTTRIAVLESTVISQAETISSQGETIAAQAQTIASLSSLTGSSPLVQTVLASNTSVTEIGDLTGPTIIVAVVKALRDLTDSSALVTTIVGLEATVANQSAQIAALTAELAAVESLTGSSTIVTTVNSLSSTVSAIADLTGGSTIVSAVNEYATDLLALDAANVTTNAALSSLVARVAVDESTLVTVNSTVAYLAQPAFFRMALTSAVTMSSATQVTGFTTTSRGLGSTFAWNSSTSTVVVNGAAATDPDAGLNRTFALAANFGISTSMLSVCFSWAISGVGHSGSVCPHLDATSESEWYSSALPAFIQVPPLGSATLGLIITQVSGTLTVTAASLYVVRV